MDELIKKLADEISNLNDEKLIFEKKNIFSKAFFAPMYEQLKNALDHNEKKAIGQKINHYKKIINQLVTNRIEHIKKAFYYNIKSNYDLAIDCDYFQSGYLNPIEVVKNKIIAFFQKMDFYITTDSELTSVEYNFDHLNIDSNHPSRSWSDTFYVSEKELLRVHNTAITCKMIKAFNDQKEIKVLSYGNVFRKDDDDPTHSHQFNQIDFVWIKKNISISNLKWLTTQLMQYLFNQKLKIKYRLSYFPFTEPSFEIDISCFFCFQKGCNVCKFSGWIEVMGAGMLHQYVLKKAQIKKDYSGMAFGLGVDRIAMLKYQINDIRRIYLNDFALLKEFRGEK